MTARSDLRWMAFLLAAVAMRLACWGVMRSAAFPLHPEALATAVTLDLTVTLPALYWGLLARGRKGSALSVVPVFLAGLGMAARLLPASGRGFVHAVEWLALPAEAALMAVLVRKAQVLRRAYRTRGLRAPDFEDAFPEALREALGDSMWVRWVGSELVMLSLALFSWRRRATLLAGERSYTVHRDAGWAAVLVALGMAGLVEGLALHVLVARWSVSAAWMLTGLNAYSVLWVLGDFRALVLRPIVLSRDALHLRLGLRREALLPRSAIASVRRYAAADATARGGLVGFALMGAPKLTLVLRRPVDVRGLFGRRQPVERIGVTADGACFEQDLTRWLDGQEA